MIHSIRKGRNNCHKHFSNWPHLLWNLNIWLLCPLCLYGQIAEKSASFKTIDPDNGNTGVLLRYVKALQELFKAVTKDRNDERMSGNSAFVLQCALFFVINWQWRYSRVSNNENGPGVKNRCTRTQISH